jgi:hypothetical protein
MSCSLQQHYGPTHGQVYQSVCLEREFSMAQIARHHFLLIGCYETPRAETGHSLQTRILIDGVPKQTFVLVEKDSTLSILRPARMTFKETLM